ncbi:hypothetical protein ACS0TY_002384 [Phlomoides rotata]
MEQKAEEIGTNETITSAELRRNISLTSNAPVTVAGCSNTKEGNNDPRRSLEMRGLQSRIAGEELVSKDDKCLLESNLRGVISSFQDPKKLSSNQNIPIVGPLPSNNLISSTTTTPAMEGPSNIMPPIGFGASFSSTFSKFFILKTTGKQVVIGNPGASDKSLTTPTLQHTTHNTLASQNENMQGYSCGEAYDTLMNGNSLSRHEIIRKGPELPYSGINLRELLESKCFNGSRNDKLRLFRKIVQTVDIEHNQGIALMELRPSSFIIFKTGDVKYIGSSMETELLSLNQDNSKKRGLEPGFSVHDNYREKMQKVGLDKLVKPETNSRRRSIDNAQKVYEGTSTGNSWLTTDNAQLEKKWYGFPEKFNTRDLLSLNIYSLGLLLFEILCHFDSIEAHSAAMLDLHHRILPPYFLSQSPREAGLCFWLLHPEYSSRPTTREILQLELIPGYDSTNLSNDGASCADLVDDAESDLLLHFLDLLKQQMQSRASNLVQSIKLLDVDLKVVESKKSLDMIGCNDFDLKDHRGAESTCSTSKMNVPRDKLLGNINELEKIYFSLRTNSQVTEMAKMDRPDKDVLTKRERLSWVQDPSNIPTTEENIVDRVGIFFDGICKFARYNKFEVCGTLKKCDILNSNNMISSLSFDREEQYIAAAGSSKKIKIFEFDSLLDDYVDVQYPILEMSSESKFSCICWNNYIKKYLVSTDYDGLVQIWDTSTGQGVAQYNEHQKRAWSVDFSHLNPTKFASGGDDCSLRIWNINERNSTCTILSSTNICCVQFSSYSSHLIAFGSADDKIYCYDLRHTRIPWCTLPGHKNAVSYAKFLDSETIVSASIDSTLKLWDLKKTSLEGSSPDACILTCRGHVNEKHFVGLAVLDGYIACGSETNEVYVYHRSLPMPIASHKFGYVDPFSGVENADDNGYFVSSVCWRRKSQMLAAANSNGTIKILRMA